MSLQKKLRGFFRKQLLGKKRDIISDIKKYGRSRDFLWRSFFTIADEAISEGYDISKELLDIAGYSYLLYKPSERIYALREIGYRLVKMEFFSKALLIFKIALRECNRIINPYRRLFEKALVLDYLFASGFNDFAEKVLEKSIEDALYLSPVKAASLLILFGIGLAKHDVGRGDSLIASGVEYAEKCESDLCKAIILARGAYGYVSVSRNPENMRVAKKWLGEAFEIIDEMPPKEALYALARIIGDICYVDYMKANQVLEFILDNVKRNEEGFRIVLRAARSLINSGDNDLSYKALNWLEDRIMKSHSRKLRKLLYLSFIVKYFGIIDGYKAQFLAKIIAGYLRELFTIEKSASADLIQSIANLSAADIDLAHNLLKRSLRELRSDREIIHVLAMYPKQLFSAFPKPYVLTLREKISSVFSRLEKEYLELIPDIIHSLSVVPIRGFDKIVSNALRLAEEMPEEEGIIYLTEIAGAITAKAKWWAEELLEYLLESIEKLPVDRRIQLLIEMSQRIYKFSPRKARELLRIAIGIIQDNEIKNAHGILLEISRQMRILFRDLAWARQIEILAREISRRKKEKR
ncbi:MAG: hypothetical protein ACTSUJ_09535 [Candidatus Njordarchaeales archaeon]